MVLLIDRPPFVKYNRDKQRQTLACFFTIAATADDRILPPSSIFVAFNDGAHLSAYTSIINGDACQQNDGILPYTSASCAEPITKGSIATMHRLWSLTHNPLWHTGLFSCISSITKTSFWDRPRKWGGRNQATMRSVEHRKKQIKSPVGTAGLRGVIVEQQNLEWEATHAESLQCRLRDGLGITGKTGSDAASERCGEWRWMPLEAGWREIDCDDERTDKNDNKERLYDVWLKMFLTSYIFHATWTISYIIIVDDDST